MQFHRKSKKVDEQLTNCAARLQSPFFDIKPEREAAGHMVSEGRPVNAPILKNSAAGKNIRAVNLSRAKDPSRWRTSVLSLGSFAPLRMTERKGMAFSNVCLASPLFAAL